MRDGLHHEDRFARWREPDDAGACARGKRGLLVSLALKGRDAAEVARAALDRGLLVSAARPDPLRFMPALTVSGEEIDEMIARLRARPG